MYYIILLDSQSKIQNLTNEPTMMIQSIMRFAVILQFHRLNLDYLLFIFKICNTYFLFTEQYLYNKIFLFSLMIVIGIKHSCLYFLFMDRISHYSHPWMHLIVSSTLKFVCRNPCVSFLLRINAGEALRFSALH